MSTTKPLCQRVYVALLARQNRSGTLEDLDPVFPEHTRRQVLKALQNLVKQDLVKLVSRGCGRHALGVWQAQEQQAKPPASKSAASHIARVSSVWGLGGESVPILALPGRRYEPLGSWESA